MKIEELNQPKPFPIKLFRILFIVSAIWNFAGSLPGIIDSAGMFEREFGRTLNDPVLVSIYRGAWATSFIYAFGFLIAAKNPIQHCGIVLMGGIGKAGFAVNLLVMYLSGWTSSFAVLVIVGDIIFVVLFALYFAKLHAAGHKII